MEHIMMMRVCSFFFTVSVFTGLILLSPAGAHEDHGSEGNNLFTKHFDRTLFEITLQGHFSIEILLNDSEYPIGKNVIGVVVHNDRDEDVAGATIGISMDRRDNDQKVVPDIRIIDKKNGLYIVSGLDLPKEYPFSLSLSVKSGGVEDAAVFLFPDSMNDPSPKGRYSP